MEKTIKQLLIFLSILLYSFGCSEGCADCLELTTKSIKYVDSDGSNLLFGDHAIYNPDSVLITAGDGTIIDFGVFEDEGTILFNLEEYPGYRISLTPAIVDTLEFTLAVRYNSVCCIDVIYSTHTFLNGQETDNADFITITVE